jgi:hypothetical protein
VLNARAASFKKTFLGSSLRHVSCAVFQVSGLQAGLAFFLGLNAVVCVWEMVLFYQIDWIERQHHLYTKQVAAGASPLSVAVQFFQLRVHRGNLASPRLWAEVWACYSVFDASYANRQSFGFFVDVGNGFTTLLPTLLFGVAMTAHGDASHTATAMALEAAAGGGSGWGGWAAGQAAKGAGAAFGWQLPMRARTVGMVGLASFWQELYGTFVYFFSFVQNKR